MYLIIQLTCVYSGSSVPREFFNLPQLEGVSLDNGWAYQSNMDPSIQGLTLIQPLVILISLNGDS